MSDKQKTIEREDVTSIKAGDRITILIDGKPTGAIMVDQVEDAARGQGSAAAPDAAVYVSGRTLSARGRPHTTGRFGLRLAGPSGGTWVRWERCKPVGQPVPGLRRVLSVDGDGATVWRIARTYTARLVARLAPVGTSESECPSLTVEVRPDGSWDLLTGPHGPHGYEVLRTSGRLGDDQCDALPRVGDTVAAYPRRVDTAARFKVAAVHPGLVVDADGVEYPIRDVRLIERASDAAAAASLMPRGYARMDAAARESAREAAETVARSAGEDLAEMYMAEAVRVALEHFDGQGLGWMSWTVERDEKGVPVVQITAVHDGDGNQLDMDGWDDGPATQHLSAAAEWANWEDSDDHGLAVGDYL
jgi:hypothetical protein